MKLFKNKKGIALPVAILAATLVIILSAALVDMVTNEMKTQKAAEQRVIAKYLAEAGIEHGFYLYSVTREAELIAGSPYSGEIERDGLISVGTYTLKYLGNGKFESVGTTETNKKTKLSVEIDPATGDIMKWEEIK